MSRILVIDGHPHPDPGHFVHALARSYADAARQVHEVRVIEVAKLDFPVLRDPEDWKTGELPVTLQEAQDDIGWAAHIVILYPLWLGDVPALLKAFLEQVARPGFAIDPLGDGFFHKLLTGRSARVIVTMGMPAAAYRHFFREHSVKSLKRNILHFVGIKPVRITLIGDVDSGAGHRETWLRKIADLGREGR
ncbi:flavodoxin family protein [Croceicoccus ponticola]|uniref:Flavodoxin family protein n=1 Tax=Croceicoccus ponticola TaxID=2217664 RepID=A0A437H1U4_9SPHN|nr:NAD(P)H-dependent oxidoreductase [Croceicoccus ponticola]RVQ69614.1 flavodoxin family protein [Croceicoccus ponticola]